MKSHLGLSLKSIFLVVTVLAAGSALAANKGSLELQHPTTVAGKQLAIGNYTVQWEGSGDQVDLKIYQGKNVVASTPARVLKEKAVRREVPYPGLCPGGRIVEGAHQLPQMIRATVCLPDPNHETLEV